MKSWICDSSAKERWVGWMPNLPPGWECRLIENVNSVPKAETPLLLMIHDGNGWTWTLPGRFPDVQVIRYTNTSMDLVKHISGQPFCSLDRLQAKLPEILSLWTTLTPTTEWLFEALSDNEIEAALELLHALLPPAIDPALTIGQHQKPWGAISDLVSRMKSSNNFSLVESSFERVRVLYQACLDSQQSYFENLSRLRDELLSEQEPLGLIETMTQARRA
ncbi:MAG TPA: hypothetical protein VJR02_27205 [Pyrinomonadaceae bacterium]|nr:hypothetical protein [Pyrinomonadaceae bacterium]